MFSRALMLALALALPSVLPAEGWLDRWFGKKSAQEAEAFAEQVLQSGDLEIRMIEGGFYRAPKGGGLFPGAKLAFKNLGDGKRFKRNVIVEFVDLATGRRLRGSKTFLSLGPGQQITRSYGSARHLSYAALADAPALGLRLRIQKKLLEPMPIPARELDLLSGRPEPMAWLGVDKVADGDTLVLASGARIRLLGVDTPEVAAEREEATRGAEEASLFTKARIGADPVKLEYDREENDDYGRWLAYVWLKDGTMLNEELLKNGMARVYTRAEFRLKPKFLELESAAQTKKLGVWN